MGAVVIPRVAGVQGASSIVFQSHTPSGVAPSGTVGANGALTLGTALAKTYAGGIFLRFPAGAVFSGSAAGSYWCVMSSTTVGTVFNNTMPELPVAPASTTAIVDAGPGAYTGVTGDVTVGTIQVPGGLMGPNGSLRVNIENSYNTTAGNKLFRLQFGGVTLVTITRTAAGGHDNFTSRLRNVGAANRNSLTTSSESTGAVALSHIVSTIDTNATQPFVMVTNLAVATDFSVSESLCIEVMPGY